MFLPLSLTLAQSKGERFPLCNTALREGSGDGKNAPLVDLLVIEQRDWAGGVNHSCPTGPLDRCLA